MLSACSPGYVNEGRSQIMHTIHSVVKILDTLGSLGREELEGEGRFAMLVRSSKLLGDVHGEGTARAGRRKPFKVDFRVEVVWSSCTAIEKGRAEQRQQD